MLTKEQSIMDLALCAGFDFNLDLISCKNGLGLSIKQITIVLHKYGHFIGKYEQSNCTSKNNPWFKDSNQRRWIKIEKH